jgi:heptosyltransferase I
MDDDPRVREHMNTTRYEDSMPPPRSICVLRLSAIGDCCHTLPVIRTLQAAWPAAELTWIIGKIERSLIGDIADIEFITFDKAEGAGAYRDLLRTLGDRRFDLLLHMHPSMRANFASLCVRAPVRLGLDRARAKDFQWLFTNRRIPPRARRHVMDVWFEFAEALGVTERVLRWDIPLPDADRAFAASQLDETRAALLISPCSNPRFRNFRNWIAERYAAVADYAAERHGMQVLLTGGPSPLEIDYGEQIVALARHGPRNLIGRTTLKQLLALIARATALVCPDSGPAHMATTVGTPVVGLYATTNRWRAGPYLSQEWVVDRYPQALAREGKTVEEVPWGARVRDPEAMSLIQVSDVTERLDALMQARARIP